MFVVYDQVGKFIFSKCPVCARYFRSKRKLKKHILGEHLKLFQCSNCDYKIGPKRYLKSHINQVHGVLDIKMHKCNNCHFKTGKIEDLNKHIREVHDGKQNWLCDICNISFKSKKALRNHEDTNHKCYSCGFKTGLKDDLNKHVHEVHDEKHFCSICGKHFFTASQLKNHVTVVHERQKNHKCYYCDFKSRLKEDLAKHIYEVHGRKQNWRCDICNESFKKKVDLQGHKRIRHDTIKKSNEKELVQKDENQTPENCHKKEKNIAKIDRTTVRESKKSRNIVNPVSKKALRNHKGKQYHIIKKSNEKEQVQKDENQKEITVFNELNENQTPENGHSKEKTIAKVDSSTVHEKKKSRNGLAISDDVPLSNVDLDGHPSRPLRPSLPTGLPPAEQPKWKSQPRLTQPPPLAHPLPGLPPVGLPPGPIARTPFRPQHPQQFQHR